MSTDNKYDDHNLKDAWIHGMVESAYILNNRINPYQINISVKQQVVTLTGHVLNEIDQWLCEEILKGIQAIKKIINKIEISDIELLPEDTAGSRQAYYHWFSDTNTTAVVKSKLLWNKSLSGETIEVSTKSGVVTLTGQVDYQANKALADLIVQNIDQVLAIKNKISVSR